MGIQACKKDSPPRATDVWLPKELKDLFLFYPGSYWIMEAPGTEFIDSIFVDSTRVDTLPILHPGSREVIGYKERFTVRFVSPFYGRYYTFSTESEDFCGMFNEEGPCHRVIKSNLDGAFDVQVKSFIYHFPEFKGSTFPATEGVTDNFVRIDSILPTYALADSLYRIVHRVTVDKDPSEQYQVSIRHLVPNVGLIRWQVPSFGFDWICVRYNSVQTAS